MFVCAFVYATATQTIMQRHCCIQISCQAWVELIIFAETQLLILSLLDVLQQLNSAYSHHTLSHIQPDMQGSLWGLGGETYKCHMVSCDKKNKKMLALFCRQNSSYHHFAVLSLYNNAGGFLPPKSLDEQLKAHQFNWFCETESMHSGNKTHTEMMPCLLWHINAYAQ